MTSFDKLGEIVDTHFDDGTSDLRMAEGRRRFMEAVARPHPAARSTRRFGLLSLATATGALLLVLGLVALGNRDGDDARPHPATGEHAGKLAIPAADLMRLESSRDHSDATVQLASGASVRLSNRTRGASRRVAAKSYRVTLDYGRMTFTIDPHASTTWIVEVGVYKVRVVGTIFTVAHDADRGSVEVHVDRGRVEISGGGDVGGLDGVVTLDAGGALRAIGNDVRIEQPSEIGELQPATRTSMRPRRPVDADWSALYDAGDYAGAWRSAQGAGYGRLVKTLEVARLSHLADAARLAGDNQGARAVLVAVRRRFSGTREATDSAFLLGRLAADTSGSLAEAVRWFETYLAEKPRGLYAQEAQGRLIVVHRRAGRFADARDAARGYLARFRGGPYSDVARSVLDEPA